MTKLSMIIFTGIFLLLGFFGYELFHTKPHQMQSALISQPLPHFTLPSIGESAGVLSSQRLKGQVLLLNVWATWCSSCSMEHDMLMKINNKYHVPIYSILYKDERRNAMEWFKERGDPFVLTGDDKMGNVAIDLGVYGTPETFIISPQGNIVYRHVGIITQETWDQVLSPILKQYGYRR